MIVLANEQGLLHLDPLNSNPADVVQYISADGSIREMPLGDFSKMVLNYEAYKDLKDGGIAPEFNKRYDVWRVGGKNNEFGFISSGRYVDNGQQVWQSFATIRGTDRTQDLVENIIQPPEISTTLVENVVYKTVLEAPVEEDASLIPIPFAPRYPLESIPRERTKDKTT